MGSSDFQGKVFFDKVASILISTDTSVAVDICGTSLVGLAIPSAITGTEITFYAADVIDGTFRELTDSLGVAITAVVAASKQVALDPSDFAGVEFLKLKSNATELAARSILLVTRPIG